MIDDLKDRIIARLLWHGRQGCSVNRLFFDLRCNKNDLIEAKDQLLKSETIIAKKEGKQKTILCLNYDFFSDREGAFRYLLKRHEYNAEDTLRSLRRLKPLFKHAKNKDDLSGVRVRNRNVAITLDTIIGILESISDQITVFTLRYHFDPHAKGFDIAENQRRGFKTIQKIIDKLILQHKNEEKELRDYLLWSATSSFSYVY